MHWSLPCGHFDGHRKSGSAAACNGDRWRHVGWTGHAASRSPCAENGFSGRQESRTIEAIQMRTIALVALAISLASWAAGTTYANASWTAFEQSGTKSSANTASNDSGGASVTGQEKRQQVGSVSTKTPEKRRALGKDRTRLLASTVKDRSKRAPNGCARLQSRPTVIPERGSV